MPLSIYEHMSDKPVGLPSDEGRRLLVRDTGAVGEFNHVVLFNPIGFVIYLRALASAACIGL